ncbi:hypothetical protein G6F46_005076 [Rhizopus delemar]|uniref:Histone-lysine N-methyltransferase, H3 lysine-79 specific n=2 Tax=Rhizopus TaxID=4842 RepID=A0A9P6YVB9_9FUNG|nr:hypothetical protein G6F55_009406 [Rhizopus delemar]KAG1537486.1 hypothetical protein G6F51_010345 [Rhizopus arrhizus]KAG1491625.1 hypothetical protein G6F54_009886 [Rhizopus delemar]KAG1513496.1 hypothetical protein G6F53_004388 [Rhizopus delemar]KAG1520817.1 hypothetical protein G6F52_007311 [Rhizopus delemar]
MTLTPKSTSTAEENMLTPDQSDSEASLFPLSISSIESICENKTVKNIRYLTQSERVVLVEILDYSPYFTLTDSHNNIKDCYLKVTLEYPGLVAPETFLLLRPIKKKTRGHTEEYDPITDLMRSINLMWEIYFTPDQRKLLGDDFMYCLERYERSQHAKGVSNLIEKFNDVIRKLKKEGALSRNVRRTRYPSYELTCHILFQIYSRTVARRSHMLNVYQSFSDNVYGEIFPSLIDEFIKKTQINSNSVFMDLGCGIGNVVLQVAAQTGCKAYGIEIMETPCKLAKRQLKEYAARMRAWRLPTGRIRFHQVQQQIMH